MNKIKQREGEERIRFGLAVIIFNCVKECKFVTSFDIREKTKLSIYFVNNIVEKLVTAGLINKRQSEDDTTRKRKFTYHLHKHDLDESNAGKVLFSVRAGLDNIPEIARFVDLSTSCVYLLVKRLVLEGELTAYQGNTCECYAVPPLLSKIFLTQVPTNLISRTTIIEGKTTRIIKFNKRKI